MHILITGATGFIGSALLDALEHQGHTTIAAVRRLPPAGSASNHRRFVHLGDLETLAANDALTLALQDVDVVIHAAARVHVMHEKDSEAEALYEAANVRATSTLARLCIQAGVRRFIFFSSIKVNGESSQHPFRENDLPAPQDAYARSKLAAEKELSALVRESSMECIILRLPLVYGAGVKGNFATMLSSVKKGYPLPFGAVDNRRSLLSLLNLVDCIGVLLQKELSVQNKCQVFLISDNCDVSTTQLLRIIAEVLQVKSRLMPVPDFLLRGMAKLMGKQAIADRLLGDLQVDSSHIRTFLQWMPPFTLDEGIRAIIDNTKGKTKGKSKEKTKGKSS